MDRLGAPLPPGPFVKLARTITAQRAGIVAAIEHRP
ncbi:MAG: transposase [Actinomycetota bacterium]|nr:transposase [Actinomycetota bacterium]